MYERRLIWNYDCWKNVKNWFGVLCSYHWTNPGLGPIPNGGSRSRGVARVSGAQGQIFKLAPLTKFMNFFILQNRRWPFLLISSPIIHFLPSKTGGDVFFAQTPFLKWRTPLSVTRYFGQPAPLSPAILAPLLLGVRGHTLHLLPLATPLGGERLVRIRYVGRGEELNGKSFF